ncbi:hypothetical protein G7Y89_g10719 [Cudoniella acicularis]|uniref:Pectinesterase n=1 Tax=Cudoniella acicularis TaxID=354080 RepID=A0A8H4REI8_9HELO|nr:hypothetical protein G7Y89_g10719 [Cudoniella acicularis]
MLVCSDAATLEVKAPSTPKYDTISDALRDAQSGDTIIVYPGIYKEKLNITTNSITLQGTAYPSTNPADNVALIDFPTYRTDDVSKDDSGSSLPLLCIPLIPGTNPPSQATVLVTGNNFKAYNLNITNSAIGASELMAVAVSSRGNSNGFYSCGIVSTQGTFYAHKGSTFISRCYIEGTLDFVFGRKGNAWFQGCTLAAMRPQGSITSQGRTDPADDGYLVFDKAKIVVGKNAVRGTKGTVFLGRSWGDYARVVFQNSDLGNVITTAGWQVYTAAQVTKNILFGEYGNINSGGVRVSWAKTLTSATDISSILPGYRDWVDSSFTGTSAI